MKHLVTRSKGRLIFIFAFASTCLAIADERVELKFVVKAAEISEALRQFTKGKPAEERNIYFLETGDMELARKGIILRLREAPGKRDDSTVKLRGKKAADLPDTEFPEGDNGEESKAEKDKVIGGKQAPSFSITVKQREGEIADLHSGKRQLKQLFSDKQERFLDRYAPGVNWGNARLLGPVKTKKWEFEWNGFSHELTAELWLLPGCEQEQMLEFSTKVKESDANEAERDLLELMRKKQIPPSMFPESKTKAVLKCLLKRPAR
jgi:hypothetical protein